MGLFLSRTGPSADSMPAAPPPETVCTKQDYKIWQYTVDNLEKTICETNDERLRENQQACLTWLEEYGLPIQKHEIWAFDGIVRCQRSTDGNRTRRLIPDFCERRHECYVIVGTFSSVDDTFPTCLLNLRSRPLLYIRITEFHYQRMTLKFNF